MTGRADHSRGGGFADRGRRWRRGARNCSPYWRTIAAAGFSRIPTPPRSSTKVHSAAIRLTTSSGVNIGAIPPPRDAAGSGLKPLSMAAAQLFRRNTRDRQLAVGAADARALGDKAHRGNVPRADEQDSRTTLRVISTCHLSPRKSGCESFGRAQVPQAPIQPMPDLFTRSFAGPDPPALVATGRHAR